jgi:hypothetical protein
VIVYYTLEVLKENDRLLNALNEVEVKNRELDNHIYTNSQYQDEYQRYSLKSSNSHRSTVNLSHFQKENQDLKDNLAACRYKLDQQLLANQRLTHQLKNLVNKNNDHSTINTHGTFGHSSKNNDL